MTTAEDWLTVDEAAARFRIHPETIYRWCRKGELRHMKAGRAYRIRPVDIEQQMARAVPRSEAVPDQVRVIVIANQKGGAGKTTVCAGLGEALAERNRRVLLIDADPQANLTLALTGQLDVQPSLAEVILARFPAGQALRPTGQPGLTLLPGSIALSNVDSHPTAQIARGHLLQPVVRTLAGNFDFVLIDCPPALGTLTTAALLAATEVIVPVRPNLFSAVGLHLFFETIATVRDVIGHQALQEPRILLNQADLLRSGQARSLAARNVIAQLQQQQGARLYTTVIPDAAAVEEAQQARVGVGQWRPDSVVALAFRALAEEVIGHGA